MSEVIKMVSVFFITWLIITLFILLSISLVILTFDEVSMLMDNIVRLGAMSTFISLMFLIAVASV